MQFTSPLYYLFLALTALVYFGLPPRWRTGVLLLASYLFYLSFEPRYIFFILTTTVVSYGAALVMSRSASAGVRLGSLSAALSVELTLLGVTKYWNPLALATGWFQVLPILVPLGISFYTFQNIGYLVDIYRGSVAAEKSLPRYALFLGFFPHLLAGPIEPARHFLPQVQKPAAFDTRRAAFGLMSIFSGLFKKFVVSNHLSPLVQPVFDDPAHHKGAACVLGILLARYQIYADFSGYTDIALGSAGILGYELSPNFRRPFFAGSITEYWRRWHISLSEWIRDYVFYPLVSSPISAAGLPCLILVTFLALGLWHGGTVNFLLYGAWQGIFVTLDIYTSTLRQRLYAAIGLLRYPRLLDAVCVFCTFFLLVVPPTLFFRADSLALSLALMRAGGAAWARSDLAFIAQSELLKSSLWIAAFGICVWECVDWLEEKSNVREVLWRRSRWLFGGAIGLIVALIFFLGSFAASSNFIYMRI